MKKIIFLIISVLIISSCGALFICAESDKDDYYSIDYDEEFKWESYKYSDSISLPYFMYVPKDYDESKEYPVVIVLQRAGKDEQSSRETMLELVPYLFTNSNREAYESIVIAAQSPVDMGWGYGYGDDYETDSAKALIGLVGMLDQNYSVNRDKIYLIGASMGGYGVWDLLIRHNNVFAAGITICAGADASKAEILKDTPIYVFHGDEDTVVLPREARNMVAAIRAAGGKKIQYVEYRKLGHEIWDDAMVTSGLLDWLFAQKLSNRYPEVLKEGFAEIAQVDQSTASVHKISTAAKWAVVGTSTVIVCAAAVVALVFYIITLRRKKKLINKR